VTARPLTDAQLRRRIAELERQAAELEAEAHFRRREARMCADVLVEREGLHSVSTRAKVSTDMVDAHRVAISSGRAKAIGAGDPFLAAIQAAGYSLRSLAEAIGISQASLSAHRKARAHRDSRPIPAARAAAIAKLTDWPADARHWPCGLSD
jgi:hypothetical protein